MGAKFSPGESKKVTSIAASSISTATNNAAVLGQTTEHDQTHAPSWSTSIASLYLQALPLLQIGRMFATHQPQPPYVSIVFHPMMLQNVMLNPMFQQMTSQQQQMMLFQQQLCDTVHGRAIVSIAKPAAITVSSFWGFRYSRCVIPESTNQSFSKLLCTTDY
jgi:hypothetical protein